MPYVHHGAILQVRLVEVLNISEPVGLYLECEMRKRAKYASVGPICPPASEPHHSTELRENSREQNDTAPFQVVFVFENQREAPMTTLLHAYY